MKQKHMKQKQKLHERFGLSVEESLNRLIRLGQLAHQWEQTHPGEKLNPAHLEAVLNANTLERNK